VRLPAYHPDTPEVRRDWAQYYDNITPMDAQAGRILKELDDAAGRRRLVFFYGDHGSGMPRSKRWPYDSGLRVPLIVQVPARLAQFAPRTIPLAASRVASWVRRPRADALSVLQCRAARVDAGIRLHGQVRDGRPKYLHGFRGRMDERFDMVRSVRNERYVYVRNYMPHLIYGQYLDYMFQTPTTRVWKELLRQGRADAGPGAFLGTQAAEELL